LIGQSDIRLELKADVHRRLLTQALNKQSRPLAANDKNRKSLLVVWRCGAAAEQRKQDGNGVTADMFALPVG
jgi:hypothetical protein